MKFDYDLVGKIGSMALIQPGNKEIDYNIFSRIGGQLRPGMIWVSSGATEIGRLDYRKRGGGDLGDGEDAKTDYAAQGQAILMSLYRQFVAPEYSVRQLLVEHQHFNEPSKREQIKLMLLRAAEQKAIPIVNYNDAVSYDENRRMELTSLRTSTTSDVVECVDNDETASVIATLVHARYLVIFTSVLGIYRDPSNPESLIREICGKDDVELEAAVREVQKSCSGVSRRGAGGAFAKLEYILSAAKAGTTVYIANAKYSIEEVLHGDIQRTRIGIR